jgi:hypothetical protein
MVEGGCIYLNGRSINEFTIFIRKLIERIEQDSSGWISMNERLLYDDNEDSM